MREIDYEFMTLIDNTEIESIDTGGPLTEFGKALSLNLTSSGMLLLTERPPRTGCVLRVRVPTPLEMVAVPTLAEVRWVQKVTTTGSGALWLVGVKFIF